MKLILSLLVIILLCLAFNNDENDQNQKLTNRILYDIIDTEKYNFTYAATLLASYLENQTENNITKGQTSLQKRLASDYMKNNSIANTSNVTGTQIKGFATSAFYSKAQEWTYWMYMDLVVQLGLYQDKMTQEQAKAEAETFGLTFQTYRLIKNEDELWEDGFFDDGWEQDLNYQDEQDWVKEMEAEMERMRKEHEEQFKQFEAIENQATQTQPIINNQQPTININDVNSPDGNFMQKSNQPILDTNSLQDMITPKGGQNDFSFPKDFQMPQFPGLPVDHN